jgi:hypothetical protein
VLVLYIDPGAGSMVIQALLAGLLTIPFIFRSAISRVVDRLRGRPSTEGAGNSGPEADS